MFQFIDPDSQDSQVVKGAQITLKWPVTHVAQLSFCRHHGNWRGMSL